MVHRAVHQNEPGQTETLCYILWFEFLTEQRDVGSTLCPCVCPQHPPMSPTAWHLQPNRAWAHRQRQEQPGPGSPCQRVPEVRGRFLCILIFSYHIPYGNDSKQHVFQILILFNFILYYLIFRVLFCFLSKNDLELFAPSSDNCQLFFKANLKFM